MNISQASFPDTKFFRASTKAVSSQVSAQSTPEDTVELGRSYLPEAQHPYLDPAFQLALALATNAARSSDNGAAVIEYQAITTELDGRTSVQKAVYRSEPDSAVPLSSRGILIEEREGAPRIERTEETTSKNGTDIRFLATDGRSLDILERQKEGGFTMEGHIGEADLALDFTFGRDGFRVAGEVGGRSFQQHSRPQSGADGIRLESEGSLGGALIDRNYSLTVDRGEQFHLTGQGTGVHQGRHQRISLEAYLAKK